MSIIDKYLKKLGIKDTKNLSEEELGVYTEWNKALKGRKLTDTDVYNFIKGMEGRCIAKLSHVDELNQKQLTFWSMQLDLISQIQFFLDLPNQEKSQTNREINALLDEA